jgi:hypothetical protein
MKYADNADLRCHWPRDVTHPRWPQGHWDDETADHDLRSPRFIATSTCTHVDEGSTQLLEPKSELNGQCRLEL